MHRITLATALASLSLAANVYAHPKLVSATPTANATVATVAKVELQFSEKLIPRFSGAGLTMATKIGVPLKLISTAALAPDGRTLVMTPKTPLTTGKYYVAWHVVSVGKRRITGNHAFAVR